MTSFHAVVLGLVQGATEFLPVSSSGHLILVPWLFGWPDQGLAFDAATHLGTGLALLVYFAGELWGLATGVLEGRPDDRRLAAAIVLGTIPAGVAGLALQHVVERELRSVTVIAISTLVWALILWWADRQAGRNAVHALRDVGIRRALVVGFVQPLALIPGTSRSGVTLSAGLFSGLDRSTAARFAFLLGLPITLAAGLLEFVSLLRHGAAGIGPDMLLIGVGTSFAAGLAAIWFLVRYLQRRTLLVFVLYRIALGLVILWISRG